jgi:hypothetical protein
MREGRLPAPSLHIVWRRVRNRVCHWEGDYGRAIITYLEGKGIGWLGWVFDPEWGPNMLRSWDTYELTGGGEFFKQALHGRIGN